MRRADRVEAARRELEALLGDRATAAASVREHHSRGESYHPPALPDLVVFPMSTEEVVGVVRIAAQHRLPLVPFGAGTSLEGHVAAVAGGISVDLSRMNRILRVAVDDLDATVEAGVTHQQLNRHLEPLGVGFFVDPGADCTLGGMAATRASGTMAVRYGTMRDNVLALTVVLADGRIVRTGSRARKSAAGYDLTRLFVGSEGTLGIITELVVRLHPLPEAVSAAVCPFASLDGAVETVIRTMQFGIPVARIELLDERQMDAVNRYARTNYPAAPTLFFEFHGVSERAVAEHAELVKQIALEHGGGEFLWALRPEDRARLWHARHHALYAALALKPGARAWTTDVCVPLSRLAECIRAAKEDLAGSPLPATLAGHAGDGNFHLIYLVDPTSEADLAEAERLNERLVQHALALGGTCTGEHGIGLGKRRFLLAEHGEGVELMRRIKQVLDPENLMNPGKIFPEPSPPSTD